MRVGNRFSTKIISRTNPDDNVIKLAAEFININLTEHNGNTSLHSAVFTDKRPKMTKSLLAERADPNITNLDGNTPLHGAC